MFLSKIPIRHQTQIFVYIKSASNYRNFRSYGNPKNGWFAWFLPFKNHSPHSDDKIVSKLLADTTKEEQDKAKIIFAEGYLAGRTTDTPKPKFFRSLLTGVFVGFCIPFLVFILLIMNLRVEDHKPVVFIDHEKISTTFADVKGVAEAKEELQDLVEFLKHPKKFSALGAKLPKGILLVGPPGTGKTMLARAVAGEAGVPFYHMSGSEFEQTFVGEGARRVRELFKIAKRNAPCVIFIDEIDSVGSKRISSPMHPHSNQTINQLLTEMDGFRPNQGVFVLGATNRREDLDSALLRPGRFDMQVYVPPPNYEGRRDILRFYLGRIEADSNMDLDFLARGTVGFTGADIENMVNQAALRAAMEGSLFVSTTHLERERDRILMGPEKKSRIPDRNANEITAFHEGGHAIVAFYTKDAYPLHKVTIVPRGDSLGHTAFIPDKEEVYVTKAQQLARVDTLMGGRAAEELIFGASSVTSGSASDLEVATTLVSRMVKVWGMSEKVGLRSCKNGELSPGQGVRDDIDAEINRILTESYERAKQILQSHSREHQLIAEALLKYETLDNSDVNAILNGRRKK